MGGSGVSRRSALAGALGLGASLTTGNVVGSAVMVTRLREDPFRLGVASGEPSSDGFVIWTRLAPRPHARDAGMGVDPVAVRWEVAEDEGLRRVVAQGRVYALPRDGHSVHVEVAGLKPQRPYWYRFRAGGHASAVGRTMTSPAPGAEPDSLKVAFASCQNFGAGYYTAHADIARAAPDLVLFLGDYIYEKPLSIGRARAVLLPAADDLESYRLRYATYKSDPQLQAAHAAAPWMSICDDHEVSNDYGGDQDRRGADPAAFLRRRAAAYRAYFEHMPLRRASRAMGASMQLYRSLDWGRLAQFQLLDNRQYRPGRTCDAVARKKRIPADCTERLDPSRSLLGARQEAWLEARLATTTARWNVLTQQQLLTPLLRADGTVSNDGWDGYPASRDRLYASWERAKTPNPIALGGDIHSFAAAEARLASGRPIASEFISGSVSSLAHPDALPERNFRDGSLTFGDSTRRGYGLMELTRRTCTVTFRAVDDALTPDSAVRDLKRFVVEAGAAGIKAA